jgi:hypothetical protein
MSKIATLEIALATALIVAVTIFRPPLRQDQIEVRWRSEPTFVKQPR